MPSVEIDALESVGQFWTIEVGINACPQRLEDLKIRIDELGYIDEYFLRLYSSNIYYVYRFL